MSGRLAGCYAQMWGWAFLAAVPGEVLKLIMIIIESTDEVVLFLV